MVTLKIVKEKLKGFGRVLEPLYLNFTLLFFLQVGKWIVNANVWDFMLFIEPKELVHLRMDKHQIRPSFAHSVDHQELF